MGLDIGGIGAQLGAVAARIAANFSPPPRPDPATIERDYQVVDERIENWSPSAFGAIPLGGIGGSKELTITEGRLLDNLTRDRGLLGLKTFSDIADQAFSVSVARVPLASAIPKRPRLKFSVCRRASNRMFAMPIRKTTAIPMPSVMLIGTPQ